MAGSCKSMTAIDLILTSLQAGQIDLAAEIKELGTNLMYAAAGRMPPGKGTI